MFNKTRKVKLFSNSPLQQEYERQIYKKVPKNEDYVDDLEIVNCDRQTEKFYKSALKEALKRIRVFFISTRLMSAIDFTEAFDVLVKRGYVRDMDIRLTFLIDEDIEPEERGYFITKTLTVGTNKKTLDLKDSKVLIKTLTHELIHYFVLGFDSKFKFSNGLKVTYKKITYGDIAFYLRQIIDFSGTIKHEEPIFLPIVNSAFLSEGYTELLASLICSYETNTYLPQVFMVELLQFVSGESYNFEGFLRKDLSKQMEFLNDLDYMSFIKHIENFHEKYMKGSAFNASSDENYLAAQEILLDGYLAKLHKTHKNTKNVTEYISSVTQLIEHLPVPKIEYLDKIIYGLKDTFPSHVLVTNKGLLRLLISAVKQKLELSGMTHKLELSSGDQIEISRDLRDGVYLHVNSAIIGDEYLKNLFARPFTTYTLFNEGTRIATNITGMQDYIKLMMCDVTKDERYINSRQVDISLAKLDTENIVEYRDNIGKLKQIKIFPQKEAANINQSLEFLANIGTVQELVKVKAPKDIKEIFYIQNPNGISDESQGVIIVEDNRGNTDFFYQSINNILYKNKVRAKYITSTGANELPLYDILMLKDQATNRIENTIIQTGKIKPNTKQTTYILEDGTVVCKLDNKDECNYYILSENKMIDTNRQNLYSESNNLLNLAELLCSEIDKTAELAIIKNNIENPESE